ncbi:MAG: hypothetical protein KDK60_04610 [Chlamydiia bacterium]|nr:hypothetical protein [Chlamydiia bacterium]
MRIEEFIQLSGPLFEAVQQAAIFPDAKTFVDCTPMGDPKDILTRYEKEKKGSSFDLKAFVLAHFELPCKAHEEIPRAKTMEEYIEKMWTVLRKPMESPSSYSTLISLPHPHIVPGGRFRECFYWDSYFTALGLMASGQIAIVKEMVENFAALIDRLGFIPNGNRVYFTSRSQPPYFAFLLDLLIEEGEKAFALSFIPHLEKEYQYWMSSATEVEGVLLNHYFDALNIPRPEAYKRETALGQKVNRTDFYQNLRAACASGWDFSSRWLGDQMHFETIWTQEILPIDLNCLLYFMEKVLGTYSKNPALYEKRAAERKQAIQTLFWNEDFFYDYHPLLKEHTLVPSLAAATPLFVGIATDAQADRIAKILERSFLYPGGFATTLVEGIHQWDMPNGWAPLEWITIQGLRKYGHERLAKEGAHRWLTLNESLFKERGTLLEKYNVRECSTEVAPGEYALQQGFGWTNGVALALMQQLGSF